MIDENSVISALEKLEEKYHNEFGYGVKEVLGILKINCDRKAEKVARNKVRSLIDRQKYPEFSTAGNNDIVYCPSGKGSGKYRLSKYRQQF